MLKIIDENKTIKPKFKRIFSSNVFIPMNNNINSKSYNYLKGFIKLVETFKKKTHNEWGLYVYYDDMLNNLKYIDKNYINNNNTNNEVNTNIKRNFQINKKELNKLLKFYYLYIQHIKNNPKKYHFIKLYSYKDTRFDKINKHNYIGHPDTYGSMIRFLPLYNTKIKTVFCCNISHAITDKLMILINKWLDTKKELLTMNPHEYIFDSFNVRNLKVNVSKILNFKEYHARIPAGMFGFNKLKNKPLINMFDDYFPKLIEKYNKFNSVDNNLTTDKNVFGYGVDEILLSYIFKDFFNGFKIKQKSKSKKKTSKLNNKDNFSKKIPNNNEQHSMVKKHTTSLLKKQYSLKKNLKFRNIYLYG